MTSEPLENNRMASIRYTVEPSSPLSSCPPSPSPPPSRKRSVSPTSRNPVPDTDTTKKLSNLELDGKNNLPAKKRAKLTPAEKAEKEKEKEEKKREKEEREKERAKIKAEKEEQKRLKDEEKVKKDLEKAKKDLEKAADKAKRDEEKAKRDEEKAKRDVEKAKKEEEKAKKEEEKQKKDRAQLRMDSFFMRKAPAASTLASASTAPPLAAAPLKTNDNHSVQPPPGATATDVDMLDGPVNRDNKSDYTKAFQPFFVRPGVKLAPSTKAYGLNVVEDGCQVMDKVLFKVTPGSSDEMDIDGQPYADNCIVDSTIPDKPSKSEFKVLFGFQPSKWKKGGIPKLSTKQILAGLNSSPVPDIFGTRKADNIDYVAELQKLPRKILKYAEDVRPAYRGTYTRVPTSSGLRKGRNPFQKSLPGVEYDYDSEAEWVQEPDDDGEDIMSEEDEDPMETGSADEMDDFLDDEEDTIKKRINVAGPLIPAASGLIWDGECPQSDELMQYKIGVLIEGGTTPINPFSKEYWIVDKRKLAPQARPPPAQMNVEKDRNKTLGTAWWTAAPQQPHGTTVSMTGHKFQPTTAAPQAAPPFQNRAASGGQVASAMGGQAALRYGQNLEHPAPRYWYYSDYNRAPSSTHFKSGSPYSSSIKDPVAKANLLNLERDKGPACLSSLADPDYARSLGIPPEEHFKFFMVYHNIDYAGMDSYASLEQCHSFIVGIDTTKVAMLESLKKMFNHVTKPMLKSFIDNYCIRVSLGGSFVKLWQCVFRKNAFSYWELDPVACTNIEPGAPHAPAAAVGQPGPSKQP
ncbi:chromatin assembly factor-I (CAF-I) p90 subunit [Orbilia javanica]|uniref:Chromatin assembly factor-I (CAF-I) p90 subunit n=1 Tax=Orbilia javanica TaxID=47235 RepID=A0AAN8P2A0_9PEZI